MFMRMVYDDSLAQAAYIIGCQRSGEALVIDPERDVDRYIELAEREGLTITAVAETHIHADFLSGARELAERGAVVYCSDEGDADWKYHWLDQRSAGGHYQHKLLKDGDVFWVGNIEIRAVHTPGHTPEHLSFLITDRGGGATEPMAIASGDFLFVGDLGRPDLLETAAGQAGAKEPSAERLFESTQRLRSLPEFLQVWPAHGSGSACGKALGAVPQSTLGYELRFNPALQFAGERDFVDFILADQPEPPLYFARMKRDNKMGPRLLGELPHPPRMTAGELAGVDSSKAAIIDTRPWPAFRTGHVPGALFHPVNRAFITDVGSMVDEDQDIYLIVEPAGVETAVRGLVRIGLDRIKGWIDPSDLEAYPEGLVPLSEIDINQADEAMHSDQCMVLDVRRAAEHAESHLPGSRNIAHTRLAGHLDELPRDKHMLVVCRSGQRSSRASALLQRAGFQVTNLAGGMLAWEQAHAASRRNQ